MPWSPCEMFPGDDIIFVHPKTVESRQRLARACMEMEPRHKKIAEPPLGIKILVYSVLAPSSILAAEYTQQLMA